MKITATTVLQTVWAVTLFSAFAIYAPEMAKQTSSFFVKTVGFTMTTLKHFFPLFLQAAVVTTLLWLLIKISTGQALEIRPTKILQLKSERMKEPPHLK